MIDEVHGGRQLPLLSSPAESGSCLPAKCLLPALPVLSRTLIIIFGRFSLPPCLPASPPHSSPAYKSIVLLVLTRQRIFSRDEIVLYITAPHLKANLSQPQLNFFFFSLHFIFSVNCTIQHNVFPMFPYSRILRVLPLRRSQRESRKAKCSHVKYLTGNRHRHRLIRLQRHTESIESEWYRDIVQTIYTK